MIAALISDSEAGLDLYASETFRDQRLDDESARAARAEVEAKPDHTRFHVLMALLRDRPKEAEEISADARARVLTGALASVDYLNDFGWLSPEEAYDAPAAQALLATGQAALPHLRPLLEDNRPAPSRGSEAATMAGQLGYRRSDYAYRYAAILAREEPVFAADAAQRDVEIAALRARL
jgi:hypothetical protein